MNNTAEYHPQVSQDSHRYVAFKPINVNILLFILSFILQLVSR